MDLILLKTFLEVARQRHFGKAAERLHVTQSAVSARIKQLETETNALLFERERNDIRLTAAGQRLLGHAETILQGWERARQEVLLEPEVLTSLAIGFPVDLWPILVRDWIVDLHAAHGELALRLHALPQALLVEQLIAGNLDLAILFEPPYLPEFEVLQLTTIPLVLAGSDPQQDSSAAIQQDYVYVDWGASFAVSHGKVHPGSTPRLQCNVGLIAQDLVERLGGSAYLAEQMLDHGPLAPVRDKALIERSAYAVFRSTHPEYQRLKALSLQARRDAC